MTQNYNILLVATGSLVVLTALLPLILKNMPLSLPIASVGMGALIFALIGIPDFAPHPRNHLAVVERLTEFVIIVSLMGAGLKLDRVIGWVSWTSTRRLLLLAMPLTIIMLWLLGLAMLGLGFATALLLAAALAPTDPVLATDIQVGPPRSGGEDETRFALTSEAGLNDGLAFPFIHAALALSLAVAPGGRSLADWPGTILPWLTDAVLWKTLAGVAFGYAAGRGLGWLLFRLPVQARLSRSGDGFVALGATCLVYGLAELLSAYGFLAVFVAALALRAADREHAFHDKLHDYAEQLERILMMGLLVLFGGAISVGNLLSALTWQGVAFGLTAVFIVRPICGWVSLAGCRLPATERAVISFYGIRGLGSIYYLAYALQRGQFEQSDVLWSTMAFIVLVSIFLHGVTVTPVMSFIDRARRKRDRRQNAASQPS